MLIELSHAAKILDSTDDELMFMVQSGDLKSEIDEDSMTWQFEIEDVLELKAKLDQAHAMLAEQHANEEED